MGQPALDPQDFLKHLKSENQVLHWEPLPPTDRNKAVPREQIRTRDSLEYLHQHWTLPDAFDNDAGGIRGKLIGIFGKLAFHVLGRYLREERELLGHIVRTSEALDRRCDELTMRYEELAEQVVNREVAEAANQARLAAWLHAEAPRPAPGNTGTGGPSDPTERAQTAEDRNLAPHR